MTTHDHADDELCPICRGYTSDEFLARVETAVAQPGRAMTVDQFEAWLDGL